MQTRQRGSCLTIWLGFAIIANILLALYYLSSSSTIAESVDASQGVIIILALMGLVNIFGLVSIWMWRKLGFYILVGSVVLVFFINFIINPGTAIFGALGGFIGVGILWYLIKDKWATDFV